MGFSPREIDAMSFWEFGACVRGYSRANGGGEQGPRPPTAEQHAAAMDFAHQQRAARTLH